jgi:hypothetical protein
MQWVQRRIEAIEQRPSAVDVTTVPTPATAAAETANSSPSSPQRANDIPSPNPSSNAHQPAEPVPMADRFLSPLDERTGPLGADPSRDGFRCSDKGFLPMSTSDYLKLLDWTGRQLVKGRHQPFSLINSIHEPQFPKGP